MNTNTIIPAQEHEHSADEQKHSADEHNPTVGDYNGFAPAAFVDWLAFHRANEELLQRIFVNRTRCQNRSYAERVRAILGSSAPRELRGAESEQFRVYYALAVHKCDEQFVTPRSMRHLEKVAGCTFSQFCEWTGDALSVEENVWTVLKQKCIELESQERLIAERLSAIQEMGRRMMELFDQLESSVE